MLYGADTHKYELVDAWPRCPAGWSFPDICGLSIDAQDRVYVFSRSEHPVTVFDREGNLLHWWGTRLFESPHGICLGPDGSIFLADDGAHTVYKFSAEGKPLLTLGNRGQPSDTGYVRNPKQPVKRSGPPFNRPTGVALSPSGDIFVSDGYGNARIHRFSPDGKLLFSWGEPGAAPGQFKTPHSVLVDKREQVWVTDRENNRIQVFTASGQFIRQWTGLARPTDIFIDREGVVYMSELENRVSIFAGDGTLLARWGNPVGGNEPVLFWSPHTLSVDSRGDLYVGEVSYSIHKVNRGLKTLKKFVRSTR